MSVVRVRAGEPTNISCKNFTVSCGYFVFQGRQREILGDPYEHFHKIDHDLKGSGTGYGLDAITEMGRALESAAKNGDGAEIKK